MQEDQFKSMAYISLQKGLKSSKNLDVHAGWIRPTNVISCFLERYCINR